MLKQDLALNNLEWLICHKTKPNQTDYYTFDQHTLEGKGCNWSVINHDTTDKVNEPALKLCR